MQTPVRAYLTVRSTLRELADRPAFDHWYGSDHLPLAAGKFGVLKAWRCWSDVDPRVHMAVYEFASLEAAKAALASDEAQALIIEYDLHWPSPRAERVRDILALADARDFSSA